MCLIVQSKCEKNFQMSEARAARNWGAHAWRGEGAPPPSARAISGVPPENSVRRDAERHTRDAHAPRTSRPRRRNLFWNLLITVQRL